MIEKQKVQFTILVFAGLLSLFAFAMLWFHITNIPGNFHGYWHIFDFILFAVVSYVIWLPILMKLLVWSIASHIRPPIKAPAPETDKRVAFITTFVPASESASLLHRILPTLVNAKHPHDTWLLDEGNDEEAKKICKQYGVFYYTRHGKEHYNTPNGKFTQKTKGGNHNSWYDEVGDNYDYVAQIDTDFVVHPEFLTQTLGYFRDPKIAFVGTPQVYGNTKSSLIARGAAEQTYNFYGPLLRGMDGMGSMMLIGANHIVRVAALRTVDHYSAHITEDLLTGMKLHSKGWKSVYVPKMLAIGEGPSDWKAYFNQQNRWAYGCMNILFNYSFKLFGTMTQRRRAYYFSIQQYYFSGLAMFLGVLCLALYFSTGIQPISLDFMNFIGSYISLVIIMGMMDLWLQRFNIRPKRERGIMWAGMYICISVWPVFLMAFLRNFKRKQLVFKVTPKGVAFKKQRSQAHLFMPHYILGIASLGGFISSFYTHRSAPIMIFWSLVCGALLLITPAVPTITRKLNLQRK